MVFPCRFTRAVVLSAAVVHRLATGGYDGETVPTLECAMSRVDLDNFKLSLWVRDPHVVPENVNAMR